jgi:bifunctional non-homologous end joining protein LigD
LPRDGLLKEYSMTLYANDNNTASLSPGTIRVTHPDREYYPEIGLTKRGLIQYYEAVSHWFLPHVQNRPMSIVRCPAGWNEGCFLQRHKLSGLPSSVKEVGITTAGGTEKYIMIEDIAGIIALVQMGTLEFHLWGATADKSDMPDQLIFDLDPGEGMQWDKILVGAGRMRTKLSHTGLRSFIKTSGRKGVHITVPLRQGYGWAQVKHFAKSMAHALAKEEPLLFTASLSKNSRNDRIFIDYLRNVKGATTIAPYSTRAALGATVSTPLNWDEVSHEINPQSFTVSTIYKRLKNLPFDPWLGIDELEQELPLVDV